MVGWVGGWVVCGRYQLSIFNALLHTFELPQFIAPLSSLLIVIAVTVCRDFHICSIHDGRRHLGASREFRKLVTGTLAPRLGLTPDERETSMSADLKPFYTDIRAHYDLSNEFYELFLDPTMAYSSGYFEREDMTLEESQLAKIDMAMRKADIQPGHRVLDIGFGWGYPMWHCAEHYGADVLGITLSQAQFDYVKNRFAEKPPTNGSVDIRIQGWEEYHEPVDRIFTLEVFEHFRYERHDAFFQRMFSLLSEGGRMLLQTNLIYLWQTLEKRGIELTHDDLLFCKFMNKEIFPGGQLCEPDHLIQKAETAGFKVTEAESLAEHYVPTLQFWADNLEAKRERAIELTSEETYDNYMRYLTGCRDLFVKGVIDVMQFTCCVE